MLSVCILTFLIGSADPTHVRCGSMNQKALDLEKARCTAVQEHDPLGMCQMLVTTSGRYTFVYETQP